MKRPTFLLCLASSCGLLLAACGSDGPVATPVPGTSLAALSQTLETDNHVFHFAPGDTVRSGWQEAYHRWATEQLGVTLPVKLQYYKYRDRSQMLALTGQNTNGWADPAACSAHTIWSSDNHEVVHVYSARIGRPSALFNEGLAVAFQTDPLAGDFEPRWSGVHVHTHARTFRRQGRLIPLGDCVPSSDFRRHADGISYPQAGSFVRFLSDHYGLDRLKALFRAGHPDDSRARVEQAFAASYGFSLMEAERRWHAFLDAWQG